mgnify:FL=1
MYLYDKNIRKYIIYELTAKKDALLSYKEKELDRLKKANTPLFYDIYSYSNNPIFPDNEYPIYRNFSRQSRPVIKNDTFITEEDLSTREIKINEYLKDPNPEVYLTSNAAQYIEYAFSMPGDPITDTSCDITYQKLSNVLNIGRILGDLFLLENNHFKELTGAFIEEQLALFEVSRKKTYSIPDLEEMAKLRILNLDTINQQVKSSRRILTRIAKLK